jgi:hypothetical protein
VNAPAHIASAEAAEAALAAERPSRIRRMAPAYRQFYGFVVTLALVLAVLAGWAWAQDQERSHPDGRLYGELAFLVLVLWWGLAILSSLLARITRAIHPTVEVPAISLGQAFVWATITAVALPVAIQLAVQNLVLGLLPVFFATACSVGIWFARCRAKWVPRQPLCVSAVVGALAVGPLAVWAADGGGQLLIAEGTRPVPGAERLANEVRPLLFFDREEQFQPVKIERAKVYPCNYRPKEPCEENRIKSWPKLPESLNKNAAYVEVRAGTLDLGEKPGGPNSAIYYHVFKRGKRLYVDYWWYFAHNPAPVARSFFCGKALTRGMLGPACAEHAADWEGITVALVPRRTKCNPADLSEGCFDLPGRKRYQIERVYYAQHDKVVAYGWEDLQTKWRKPLHQAEHAGARNHPLVFVALDSHASYADKCLTDCRQLVRPEYPERRGGETEWTNNRNCAQDGCLLPLTTKGKPWKWNAYDGHWGPHHCILLDSYCDTQRAPKSPAFQARYRGPCFNSICENGLELEDRLEALERVQPKRLLSRVTDLF